MSETYKRVLILADSFPPGFAPRMGYLAKYLGKYAWKGEAVSFAQSNVYKFQHLVEYIPFHEAGIYEEQVKDSFFLSSKKLLSRLFFKGWSWTPFDEKIYNCSYPLLKEKHFDLILCSTSSFFPLEAAYRLARKFHLPLILDFRDIYEQSEDSFKGNLIVRIRTLLYKRRRNLILKKAKAITSVSPWHKDFLSCFNRKSYLIYNGFDMESFYPRTPLRTKKFTIVYTGTVTPFNDMSTRDPGWLFKAIADLNKDNKITSDTFCIKFFTDDRSILSLKKLIKQYDISDFVKLEKWVIASKIPEILASANLLLVLAAQSGTKGILTTKLFEYLAMGRTILCVPSDNADISQLLSRTSAGFAAEGYEETYTFLEDKYIEWQQTGFVASNVNFDIVKSYTRENQVKQFIEIFNEIVE